MFRKLLENHILTNLTFLLVLVMGWVSYYQLPREQDPSINFNWVQIWTYWPGATAPDVENRITIPLENGIKQVQDIKFVSSTSREGISSILVRFADMGDDEFDKRMTDLRRELEARRDQLPESVKQPDIFEISSSKAFATATLVVSGRGNDDVLQSTARRVMEDLERIDGVDDVLSAGDRKAELQVDFLSDRLLGLGISPVDLADTVRAYFRDLAAGSVILGDQKWLVRLTGTSGDPSFLETFPIVSVQGEVLLRSIAEVKRGREDARELVRYDDQNAVLVLIFKKGKANNLELLEEIKAYIQRKNRLSSRTGVYLTLLDDQTEATRSAIGVMERNALIGLLLVLMSTALFLGLKIALFTSIGIPFVLAGVFWVLGAIGETLNVTVLLGIVISLGMLVDDAVVVVEAIYFHLQRGMNGIQAARNALQEVAAPVTTAVLTTIAAFLPLMLLPGVLGDFMRVVPVVVSVGLVISLIEAFWMLPSHLVEFQPDLSRQGRIQLLRNRAIRGLRRYYTRMLIGVLRRPKWTFSGALALLVVAGMMIFSGLVRVDFFATDLFRLFYVNVEMPPGTSLEKTSATLENIEKVIRERLQPGDARGVVNYAGQQFTDKEVLTGDDRGQIFVSLTPANPGARGVEEVIEEVRDAVLSVPGPLNVSFLRRKTGPPSSKPVSIKVRGDDVEEIRKAVIALKEIMADTSGIGDISDDDTVGGMELRVQLNPDTITRARLNPSDVARAVRLFADGEIVASMQYKGEKLDVRVRARPAVLQDIDTFLSYPLGLEDGREIPLGELLKHEEQVTVSNIRRYNFRRAVTVEADLNTEITDTLTANKLLRKKWLGIGSQFPGVSLDFSGEMDDIQESLGAMAILFILGLGLIYLILGTQFKSYFQPLIVLSSVPMAFIGVVMGLFISNNPMSLFTLYGAVALAGIAANDAIVLISTANRNLDRASSVMTSVVRAARRRVVPILITSLTTIAGLFSLAAGLGGASLMWGPVATAIVWGLGFSTLLTLFVIPLGYSAVVKPRGGKSIVLELPDASLGGSSRRVYGLFDRIKRLFWFTESQEDKTLEKALTSPDYQQLYEEGVDAMLRQEQEHAIRCFQSLAEAEPQVKTFNIYAAQSQIMLMQRIGWDVGYMARAKKYLARAKAVDMDDKRITALEKAYMQLEKDHTKS